MKAVTRDELVSIIDDIRRAVEASDSWEGYLNYLMPDPDAEVPDDTYAMVEARYRVGNRWGQGGMRMVGVEVAS